MPLYTHKLERNGITFRADLSEESGGCVEQVFAFDASGNGLGQLHGAMFPSSNLGSASREEYTRVMLASVADNYFRESK